MATLIVESVLRSLLMAAVVGCGIKLLRVRHMMAQKIAWGLVLAVAIAMPLLMRWQARHPGTALVVPVQRVPAVAAIERRVTTIRKTARPLLTVSSERSDYEGPLPAAVSAAVLSIAEASPHPVHRWHARDLLRYLLPAYLVVCGALLLRLFVGLAMAWHIWNDAELASPILEPRATVRISDRIQSPVTIGSGMVLPANYTEWGRTKLRLVLAHERSHVRQGDFYLQLLASFYAALVWFSPLGWWLKRRLADLGEALSDRAALLEADDNSSYAEVLLEFAAMPRHGFAGVTAGVGMARSSNIQGRIERILNDRIFRGAFQSGRRHALIASLLVPCGLVLSTALLHVQAAERVKAHAIAVLKTGLQTQPAAAPVAKEAPAKIPAIEPDDANLDADTTAELAKLAQSRLALLKEVGSADEKTASQSDLTERVADYDKELTQLKVRLHAAATAEVRVQDKLDAKTLAVIARADALTPVMVEADTSVQEEASNVSDYDSDSQGSFAIVDGGRDSSRVHSDYSVFGGSWNGDDHGELDRVRSKVQGPFIWFERDGKSYVITDPALVAKAKAVFAPQSELGQKQAELGRQQAELGRQQGLLAARQAMVKVEIPDISKEMAELQRSMQTLAQEKAQEVTEQNLSELQAKLGEMQGKLAAAQALAGSKQAILGSQQGDLGHEQSELGRRQGELGREQGRIAREASRQVRAMIDQAVRDGKAKPVE